MLHPSVISGAVVACVRIHRLCNKCRGNVFVAEVCMHAGCVYHETCYRVICTVSVCLLSVSVSVVIWLEVEGEVRKSRDHSQPHPSSSRCLLRFNVSHTGHYCSPVPLQHFAGIWCLTGFYYRYWPLISLSLRMGSCSHSMKMTFFLSFFLFFILPF